MILISVKSQVVDAKRQFETDAKAMAYLKTINRFHMAHRMKIAGSKPKKLRGKGTAGVNKKRLQTWREVLASCVTLKVEIINTKFNQLNLL
jgi:hypothetical protein